MKLLPLSLNSSMFAPRHPSTHKPSASFYHLLHSLLTSLQTSHGLSVVQTPLLAASPHPLMSLISSSSFFVYISCHIQTGILASGLPPLTAPLWDHRFSPRMGNFYHDHAKRLTTCHEKIVECQGQKTRGLESMLIIVFIQPSRLGGLPSHVCLSSQKERVVWQEIGPVFGKKGKRPFY